MLEINDGYILILQLISKGNSTNGNKNFNLHICEFKSNLEWTWQMKDGQHRNWNV